MRLAWHKTNAVLACLWYRFPANRLRVIGVTGTSGKSSTVEILYALLHRSGKKVGSLSSIAFHIDGKDFPNHTLRTTMSPWKLQYYLRRMVKAGCEFAILEVSSHALDQNRVWGVSFDTALLTNLAENEHLDYHGTVADYVRTKMKLFQQLNRSYRKPHVPKTIILNRDDANYELFAELPADQKWTFSRKKPSDFQSHNLRVTAQGLHFDLRLPNENLHLLVPLIGEHHLENVLAAIATGTTCAVAPRAMPDALSGIAPIPGRLEPINEGQAFSVLVDYTYKPAALKAVFAALKPLARGRIICVWGGAGGRSDANRAESAQILHDQADEIILTTDDPYDESPKAIAKKVREHIPREEGAGFFEIEDRYEAIRYALYTAQDDDIVLISGRGHETTQTIGRYKIPFDDRQVCREILSFVRGKKLLDTHQ